MTICQRVHVPNVLYVHGESIKHPMKEIWTWTYTKNGQGQEVNIDETNGKGKRVP